MNTKLNAAEADAFTEMPLVTVYMPTHNRVELLQRAVESVLTQTYENIELIIVDDKSTDSTPEYLEAISKKDPRVRFFRNEENSGACVSRNKAIFAAKGEFITGLDDDDYFLEGHIASFLKKWSVKDKVTIALYTNIYRKTSKGIKKAYKKIKKCKAEYLIHSNWLGNQVFTKTEYLIQSGGFDPDFPAWQDLDCWYSLLNTLEGIAESTQEYSYVLDISHPHERISNNKIDVVRLAYNIFRKKHELCPTDAKISKLMLVHYGKVKPNIYISIRSLAKFFNWHNFRRLFILYYISI